MKIQQNANPSIARYLKEIGQFPLLTREEEQALGRRIQNGDLEARNQMISANLRLVVKMARDHRNRGLPLEDLICEGNIGLTQAVERFDPSYGVKLSTYAAFWIKKSIKTALGSQTRTIRVPLHIRDKLAKLSQSAASLGGKLGREPTEEELAHQHQMSLRQLSQLRQASFAVVSLDACVPGSDDDGPSLAAVIADETAPDPHDETEASDLLESLSHALLTLNERERCVVAARYGLDDGIPKTLAQVGQFYGVTRERIRQVQKIAMRKLGGALERLENRSMRHARLQIDKSPAPETPPERVPLPPPESLTA